MPDALKIDFAVTNADKVARAFARFAALSEKGAQSLGHMEAAAKSATAAYHALNTQIARFNRLTGSSGGSSASAPSGGGSSSGGGGRQRFVSGPFQRQQILAQQFSAATAQNNHRAMADVRLAQVRNQKQVDAAMGGPKSLKDKFFDVAKTSRFSVEGGKANLMPLVGKTLGLISEALGPEMAALAGPIGFAAGAAVQAGKAIWELSKNAAEAAARFSAVGFQMGNLGMGNANAIQAGRASGLSPEQTAGVAGSIQNAITSSGMGRAMGAQMGMFNISGPFGSQNTALLVTQAFNALRKIKDLGQRKAFADATGSSALLPGTLVSDRQLARGAGDAGINAKVFDEDFQKKSADFNDAMGRVSSAFQNLEGALGKPLLDKFTAILNGIADAMNTLAGWLNSPAAQFLLKALPAVAMSAAPGGAVLAGAANGGGMSSTDANTKALEDNTKAVSDASKVPGMYGSDPQGRRAAAFPSAAGYEADPRSRGGYVGKGMALGAFAG